MPRDNADVIPLVFAFDALARGLPITANAIMHSCNDAYTGRIASTPTERKENRDAEYSSHVQTRDHTACPQGNPEPDAGIAESVGPVPKRYRRAEAPRLRAQIRSCPP